MATQALPRIAYRSFTYQIMTFTETDHKTDKTEIVELTWQM